MKTQILVAIVISLLIGGSVGFLGGTQYQKTKLVQRFGADRQFPRQGGPNNNSQGTMGNATNRGFRNGMAPVNGEILELDEQTITVKTSEGNKVVIYSDSTAINKTTESNRDDLKVGESILVIGTANDQGSITAQSISLGTSFPNQPTRPDDQ